jgi:hypothetical protein
VQRQELGDDDCGGRRGPGGSGDDPAPGDLPVVLICGVVPFSAAVAMFNLIFTLMQASSSTGEGLDAAALALSAKLGRVLSRPDHCSGLGSRPGDSMAV